VTPAAERHHQGRHQQRQQARHRTGNGDNGDIIVSATASCV